MATDGVDVSEGSSIGCGHCLSRTHGRGKNLQHFPDPPVPSFSQQARAAAALRRAAARGDTEKERCALLALYLGMLVSRLTTAC